MEKFCLITGASCGIGLEFAKIFAKNGHNLILVARSKDKLEKLKSALEKKYSIKAVVHVSDLTSESELDKLYEDVTKYACVDILVNNAGFANFGAFLDLDYERQKALIDLNQWLRLSLDLIWRHITLPRALYFHFPWLLRRNLKVTALL